MHGLLVLLERPQHNRHDVALLALDAQVLLVPGGGGHGVVEELHEAGQFGLAALGFDDVDGVVVGIGVEFHEDFADQADARLARDVAQGEGVEGAHALADDLSVGDASAQGRHASRGDPLLDVAVPRAVQVHRGAGGGLVGAHAQQHRLDGVADDEGLDGLVDVGDAQAEARVVLESLDGQGDDGDLRVSGVAQALAQQGRVVAGAAHAARLGDADGRAVGVGAPGDELVEELADDDDRRVARVVVDVFEADLHGGAARVLQDAHLQARAREQRGEEAEVDRGHLGGEDLVSGLAHLLGEGCARLDVAGLLLAGGVARGVAQGGGVDGTRHQAHGRGGGQFRSIRTVFAVPGPGLVDCRGEGCTLGDRSVEGAQADLRGAEVGYLVDFQDGVHVAAAFEDFLDLVGGDRVDAAAEGVELDHLEVGLVADAGGGLVEARVVGPLVEDAQGALEAGVHDGVLGEDCHAQAHDDLGDAVVDLGVEVVGAAREHDAAHAMLTHPLDGFDALRADFGLDGGVFLPGLVEGGLHLLDGDVVAVFLEGLGQVCGQILAVAEVDEGADELCARLQEALHVVADDLGVGRHDGAVEGVFGLGELLLEVDAGVEDRRDALVQQGLDVSVDQLGRVAHVLRGDGLHAGLEEVVVGAARDHDAEAQLGEHREPERVVLVHAEHARDTDVAAERLFLGEAAVSEDPLVLPVVEVGQLRLLGHALQGGAALAAVARHVALAVGERRDGHLAVVLAQAAGLARGVDTEALEGLDRGQGRGPLPRVVHARGQGGAVRAHEARDVGAHDLTAGEQLEGAQHRVVEEGAALDDDALTQVRGLLELDDLVEGVAHDGV